MVDIFLPILSRLSRHLMRRDWLWQVVDNAKGIVEVVAPSNETATKAQELAQRLLEEPEAGRIYRQGTSSCSLLH